LRKSAIVLSKVTANYLFSKYRLQTRTVARTFSIGGLWVCAGGLGVSFGGAKPPKAPRGNGTASDIDFQNTGLC